MTTPLKTEPPEVQVNGVALVALDGELDLATAETLGERLIAIIDGGCSSIVVDMAGLTFCDSSGLSALTRVGDHACEAGGKITLVGIRPQLASILQITGLAQLFEVLSPMSEGV
jgi:anti-sigma B factor antagonist